MFRKTLLVITATILSYALTVIGGYVIVYTMTPARTDAQLSVFVRFVLNPVIALLVGGVVGILSKDHPAWTSAIGLVAWALLVHGSRGSGGIPGVVTWTVPVVTYIAIGAEAASLAWRLRRRASGDRPGIRAGVAAS